MENIPDVSEVEIANRLNTTHRLRRMALDCIHKTNQIIIPKILHAFSTFD